MPAPAGAGRAAVKPVCDRPASTTVSACGRVGPLCSTVPSRQSEMVTGVSGMAASKNQSDIAPSRSASTSNRGLACQARAKVALPPTRTRMSCAAPSNTRAGNGMRKPMQEGGST